MTTTAIKTYMAKPGEVEQQWWVVDADNQVVGRLAVKIATLLMGKHRPTFTPHVDTGDCVIVLNCGKVAFTGNKWEQKKYTWYTGYTGQKSITARDRLERHPDRILREAVRRMLPKNRLGRKMLLKLKLYTGTEHPHVAQNPQPMEGVTSGGAASNEAAS
jgi:large subunit ribosomal protein L13